MSALRLDLYRSDAGRGWRLWKGSRIVSHSGSQTYSRRVDQLRGAESGAGLDGLVASRGAIAWRYTEGPAVQYVTVRALDEREVAR